MSFCQNCGKKLDDGVVFCRYCGARVDDQPAAAPKTPQEGKQSNRGMVIGVIAACVVILIAAAAITYFIIKDRNDPEKVAALNDKGRKYLEEQDYEKAVDPFHQAIKIDPDNMEAYDGLATAYSALDDNNQVTQTYDTAMEQLRKKKGKTLPEKAAKVAADATLHAVEQRDSDKANDYIKIINDLMPGESTDDPEIEDIRRQTGDLTNYAAALALLDKLEALEKENGEEIVHKVPFEGDEKYGFMNAQGVCFAKLVNTDSDHEQELVVAYGGFDLEKYSVPGDTGKTPKYEAWTVEVWDYSNGTVKTIYTGNPVMEYAYDGHQDISIRYKEEEETLYLVEGWTFNNVDTNIQVQKVNNGKTARHQELKAPNQKLGTGGEGEFVYELDGKRVAEDDYIKAFDKWMDKTTSMSFFNVYTIDLTNDDAYRECFETVKDTKIALETIVNSAGENSAKESNKKEEGKEKIELPAMSMVFASGAGAWSTGLDLKSDGSFTGDYHDMDMGDRHLYECQFSGKFTDIKKVDEYTYSCRVGELKYEKPVGETWYADEVTHEAADSYGIVKGDQYYIHLKGKPVNKLSEQLKSWSHGVLGNDVSGSLPCNALENVKDGNTFFEVTGDY